MAGLTQDNVAMEGLLEVTRALERQCAALVTTILPLREGTRSVMRIAFAGG